MLEWIVKSIFDKGYDDFGEPMTIIKPWMFFTCIGVAIALGLIAAFVYMYKNQFSKTLVITMAILPPIVCVLIMLVSGSIGAAVAVGGVFALTRFRSAQGSAKEITQIFLAMAVGLTTGLGYIYIAIILVLIVEAMLVIFTLTKFGESSPKRRTLKVSIPEELDYTDIFDDLFEKYTNNHTLIKVKLKNLGTIFQLTYDIQLKDPKQEKIFIDEIRQRNANLDILCSRQLTNSDEL
ncbi:MAG: DUF4956 domain-containing protein [Clostridia bacterium]|nr:DUF4956 domain-containing protein [Clostridia bacterium]